MLTDGAGRLAGMLSPMSLRLRLFHLSLSRHDIGAAGAESLARVLGAVRSALAHLNLEYNGIGAVGKRRLGASWRGYTPLHGLLSDFLFKAPNGMLFIGLHRLIGLHRCGSSRLR